MGSWGWARAAGLAKKATYPPAGSAQPLACRLTAVRGGPDAGKTDIVAAPAAGRGTAARGLARGTGVPR